MEFDQKFSKFNENSSGGLSKPHSYYPEVPFEENCIRVKKIPVTFFGTLCEKFPAVLSKLHSTFRGNVFDEKNYSKNLKKLFLNFELRARSFQTLGQKYWATLSKLQSTCPENHSY